MIFLSAAIPQNQPPLTITEAFQVMLLGMLVVLFVLVFLFAMIRVLRKFTETVKKKAQPQTLTAAAPKTIVPVTPGQSAPPPTKIEASAGEVKLNTVDDKTAALLFAIVANETDIPLPRLKIISICETDGTEGVNETEQGKGYAFKIRKEPMSV